LGILSQVEDNLWFSFSAFFRADPCLRHLEGLLQDLSQKVQRMRVGCFAPKLPRFKSPSHTPQEAREIRETRRLIHTLLDARQNLISPADDISSPPDEGNNIQTCGADAASQPDEPRQCEADAASPPKTSWRHGLSGGHSTGIETMSTGSGSLRRRGVYLGLPVSRDFLSLDQQPEVQKAMKGLVVTIRASQFFIDNELEPILGTSEAAALMAVESDGLWRGYGMKGESIYSLFIKIDRRECKCLWCDEVQMGTLQDAIGHVRKEHLGHKPFLCKGSHFGNKVW